MKYIAYLRPPQELCSVIEDFTDHTEPAEAGSGEMASEDDDDFSWDDLDDD